VFHAYVFIEIFCGVIGLSAEGTLKRGLWRRREINKGLTLIKSVKVRFKDPTNCWQSDPHKTNGYLLENLLETPIATLSYLVRLFSSDRFRVGRASRRIRSNREDDFRWGGRMSFDFPMCGSPIAQVVGRTREVGL
jgi:hypothetical protein